MQQLLTVREVANLLKIHYRSVINLIHEGKLEAHLIGNAYRITESAYHRYLDSMKVNIHARVASL